MKLKYENGFNQMRLTRDVDSVFRLTLNSRNPDIHFVSDSGQRTNALTCEFVNRQLNCEEARMFLGEVAMSSVTDNEDNLNIVFMEITHIIDNIKKGQVTVFDSPEHLEFIVERMNINDCPLLERTNRVITNGVIGVKDKVGNLDSNEGTLGSTTVIVSLELKPNMGAIMMLGFDEVNVIRCMMTLDSFTQLERRSLIPTLLNSQGNLDFINLTSKNAETVHNKLCELELGGQFSLTENDYFKLTVEIV